jgi:hypothetical protein
MTALARAADGETRHGSPARIVLRAAPVFDGGYAALESTLQ